MAQINKGSDYFNTITYTGTGSSNSLTGVGFQPDWVWIKKRNGAVGHRLYDAVRGVQNTLFSSDTAAEATGQSTTLTAFNSDGFTVISESGVNASGDTYVAWNWLGANTTASNTDGSITSTVSVNTTAGFSIVSYTGSPPVATVGHGLNAVPSFMILKDRDAASDWIVFHSSLANNQYLDLNNTNAVATDTNVWNNTAPTSSVFTVGDYSYTNPSSRAMIAYCFAEKKGFSKFGKYTGNGSADGTFVYTGFKPAFVMVKRTDTINDWKIIDNKRATFNVAGKTLKANSSDAEDTGENYYDFCSNGFKIRNSAGAVNASGGTYIYMAFAENPLVTSTKLPATAR